MIICIKYHFTTFFFILQRKGDRYYLNGELVLKHDFIMKIKDMNVSYPFINEDYDVEFLYLLCHEIFKETEIEKCRRKNSLKFFFRPKFQFLKRQFNCLR